MNVYTVRIYSRDRQQDTLTGGNTLFLTFQVCDELTNIFDTLSNKMSTNYTFTIDLSIANPHTASDFYSVSSTMLSSRWPTINNVVDKWAKPLINY